MKTVNWGIIGLGNIALKFADAFNDINNAKLVGVSSKNNSKLNTFKNKYRIEEKYCFKNYKDLIESANIDIVYIALPNNLHYDLIDECIKAKKNILVEKPALMTVDEVLDIKKKLYNNNIYFTEGFMYKFCPHIKTLTKEILNGSIGELTHMYSNFSINTYKISKLFGFTFKKPNFLDRLYNKELGGGSIFDLGCYPVSLSTQIASLKKSIDLNKINIINIKKNICESGVDISASGKIEYNNGFFSEISCSFENKSNQKTIIYGKLGKISIESTWTPEKKCKINLESNKETKDLNIDINKNIYSYEINEISNQLIEDKITPKSPAINIDEILLNTSIINSWIKQN